MKAPWILILRRSAVLIALGGLLSTYYLAWTRQAPPPEQRAAFDATQREILYGDAALKKNTLEVRYGMVHQYDHLVALADQQQQATQSLHEQALALAPSDPEMDRALSDLQALLDQQREDLESFKSHNSILKNSLRYLPLARTELERQLQQHAQLQQLGPPAEQVMLYTMRYNAFRDQEDQRVLQAALRQLEFELAQLQMGPRERPHPRQRNQLDPKDRARIISHARLVSLHGQVCAREDQEVQALLVQLRQRPLKQHLARINQIYLQHLQHRDAEAEKWTRIIYASSAALLLGLLALGFWLRRLYATLEQKVQERTQALSQAHADVSKLYQSNRLVLDSVEQGLLTIDLEGQLSPERSAITERWFSAPQPEDTLITWLRRHNEVFADSLELGLEELRDGFMPAEIILSQLPTRFTAGDQTFELLYRPISPEAQREDAQPERLLVIINDITQALRREQEEARQRQVVTLAQKIAQDREGILEFIQETERLLACLKTPDAYSLPELERLLHTLKGNTSLYGLHSFAQLCHHLEDELEEQGDKPSLEQVQVLEEAWQALRQQINPLLGQEDRKETRVRREDLETLRHAISTGRSHGALAALLEGWRREPLQTRFERIQQQLARTASRLDRPAPEVLIQAAGIRLEPERWRSFWAAWAHLLRNTLDHGLEPPQERLAAGKPERGRVSLTAHTDGEHLLLRIADDGRGVDWAKVADRARELGLPHLTPEELSQALFADGLSTRDQITSTSGRGVGMSAVKQATEELGGQVSVHSVTGKGAEFIFRFDASCVFQHEPPQPPTVEQPVVDVEGW